MLLGVCAMACAPFSQELAGCIAGLAQPCTSWLITVAHWTAGFPSASVSWPTGWWGGLALAVLIVAATVLLSSRRFRVLLVTLALLAALFVVPPALFHPGWPPAHWAMVDCDVGQGDSEVLATATPGRAV